jgi:hypothetical protein
MRPSPTRWKRPFADYDVRPGGRRFGGRRTQTTESSGFLPLTMGVPSSRTAEAPEPPPPSSIMSSLRSAKLIWHNL